MVVVAVVVAVEVAEVEALAVVEEEVEAAVVVLCTSGRWVYQVDRCIQQVSAIPFPLGI